MLTEQEKSDLKLLTSHAWYKVLERLERDLLQEYLSAYKHIDFTNEKSIEILKTVQIYVRAREDFLRDTNKHIQEVQSFSISDYFKKAWQEGVE